MEVHPVAVIGAGPAGLAAAMQLARQGTTSLVFERNRIGGLLLNANLVENYPGFVEGISGPDLVNLFWKQAKRWGVEVQQEEVIYVDFEDGLFRIGTNHREVFAEYLIAASGTTGRTLPDDRLEGDLGEVIFTDVYPLIGQRDKRIIIIGAGDAALDYALNLARYNNQVIILNRGNRVKGLNLLWKRVQENKSIEYHSDKQISRVIHNDSGRISVQIKNGAERDIFEADYLITAIGRDPAMEFAKGNFTEKMPALTNRGKLYCIGDLSNGRIRQTALAVGDGIQAAMFIGLKMEKEKL